MKIVMTLLVRNEVDVIDAHLRFHLERGVDFIVATDHRSTDGTSDVLRQYEREGHVHVIREERQEYLQPIYVTRMARLAVTEFGADWVLNSDADEFWWPREGSLGEIVAAVPPRFGVLVALWRHFVLRPDSDEPFYERMLWRRKPSVHATSPYTPAIKVVHRGDPNIRVGGGNHKAYGDGLVLLRDWIPIEVLHFPIRSRAHLERKFGKTDIGNVRPGPHWVRVASEIREGGLDPIHERYLVDDDELAAGLAARRLTEDTRVRDVLRGEPVVYTPSLDDDIALGAELSNFREAGSYERLRSRLDGLEGRVEAFEGALELTARRS